MPSPVPLREVIPLADAQAIARTLLRTYYFVHVFHLAQFLALWAQEKKVVFQNPHRADTALLGYARTVFETLEKDFFFARPLPSRIPELAPVHSLDRAIEILPNEQGTFDFKDADERWKRPWSKMQGSAQDVAAYYHTGVESLVDPNDTQSERYTQFYALTSVRIQLEHRQGICRELKPYDRKLFDEHVAFEHGGALYCTKQYRYYDTRFDGIAALKELLAVAGDRKLMLIPPQRLREWQQDLSNSENPGRRFYGDFFQGK